MISKSVFLSVAGFKIGIRFKKSEQPNAEVLFKSQIKSFYKGFVVLKKPEKIDFWVEVIQRKDFEVYIRQSKKNNSVIRCNYIIFYEEVEDKKIVTFYHLSMQQLQLILREICQKLLARDNGFIVHASAANLNGYANIFLGSSGAGKSTVMTILSSEYDALADDTIIIKKGSDNEYFFYQTPFLEKNAWINKSPAKYKLGKAFVLKQSEENKIDKITNKEKLIQIMVKQFFTKQEDLNIQMKNLLEFIANFNDFYSLGFNLKDNKKVIKLISNV